ncbi:hypothetical protein [Shimazuella kribbensis]|uniref:hypothetical protein n=1 Tax=Shimazuella kribbensis TaxID=139808 RepID=UPI0003FFE234|nr:hypothetical protein [Shimazuella kribbensis]
MLRIMVEGEASQVDKFWGHLKMDSTLHLWDQTEMIKPNSNEKNRVCYVQLKEKEPSLSRICMTTENGELISFDLSNCQVLELETGKQLVLGYHYDIFGS